MPHVTRDLALAALVAVPLSLAVSSVLLACTHAQEQRAIRTAPRSLILAAEAVCIERALSTRELEACSIAATVLARASSPDARAIAAALSSSPDGGAK